MKDLSNPHQESSPHQEAVGNFVVPTERKEESSSLSVPEGSLDSTSTASLPDEAKQKNQTTPKENKEYGLTYKQQLKQDAMLWAEFLYSEYKREKVLLEEAQTMPTHYDKPIA